VFLIGFLICCLGIGSSIIYILDEAKNSEAAREMMVYGEFFKPTFNNVIRTDKPPFHYFFMMLGYKLFGVNAFGARFFSAVFGAFTILSTYLFTKKHLGQSVAKITFWILIASFYFVQEFHLAVPDPYLIFWVSLTFFCYIDFYITKEKNILGLLYFAIGCGMLTKGPVALVLPGLIAVIHLIILKNFNLKTILSYKIFLGLLLAFFIAVPWFYWAHLNTDGVFTEGFFLKHNINRFQNKMEGHGGVFLITIGYVVLGMFPFSFWLFRSLFESFKQKRANAFVFFCGLAVFIFVSFFAISSTKLPNYTMPCYPLIAVLLAWFFNQFALPKLKKDSFKLKNLEWGFLIVISTALPIAGYFGLTLEKQLNDLSWVAFLIAFVPLGVFWAYYKFMNKKFVLSFKILVVTFVLLGMVLFGAIFPILTKQTPVEKYKEVIGEHTPVVIYKRFDASFPINFNKTFPVIQNIEGLEVFFNQHPNGVVMTNLRRRSQIQVLEDHYKLILKHKSLFENHTTRVYQKYK